MSVEFGRAFAAHLGAVLLLDEVNELQARSAVRLVGWLVADLAALAHHTAAPGFAIAAGTGGLRMVVAGTEIVPAGAYAPALRRFAEALAAQGCGGMTVRGQPERDPVFGMIRRVRSGAPEGRGDRAALQKWLDINGCDAFRLTPMSDDPTTAAAALKLYGRLWYAVSKARDSGTLIPDGRPLAVPDDVARAIRGIVDRTELAPRDTVALAATLDREDDVSTRHAVHGSVLAVALGHATGLRRGPLAELGVCALLAAGLRASPENAARAALSAFPREAPLTVDALRRSLALHDALAPPPEGRGARPTHLFGRIIAVVLEYNALVTGHDRGPPMLPRDALVQLTSAPGRRTDRALLRAFASLLGDWPIGSCVLLDSGEVAIVLRHGPNGPVVRPVVDARGAIVRHGPVVPLEAGGRRATHSVDPARLGINPADALFG